MDRLSKFEHNRFIGDKRTLVVYDIDELGAEHEELAEQLVQPHRSRIIQLLVLVGHQLRDLLRPASGHQDPAVAFTLDERLRHPPGA